MLSKLIGETQDGGFRALRERSFANDPPSVGDAVSDLLLAAIAEGVTPDDVRDHLRYAQDQIGKALAVIPRSDKPIIPREPMTMVDLDILGMGCAVDGRR